MKIFLLYFFFILFNNCSFDNKSGIWKNENNIDKNQKDTFKQFKNVSTSIDPFTEIIEIKKNYEFKLSKKINPTSWKQIYLNQNNNLNNFEYNNLNEIFFRSKKISKYKVNDHILYEDGNIINSDLKGNINIFSVSNNKILTKFNFYKNKYKKIKKKLNLIVENNVIYVADNFGYLYAYNYLDEKLLWAKNYNVPFRSNLKIYENIIFAANQNNNLFFFDKQSGEILKKIPTEETIVKNNFINSLSLNEKNIFFLNTYGSLYSINLKSKRVNWFLNLNQSLDVNPSNIFYGSQLLNYGNKIIASSNQFLYVINSNSGSIIMKKNFPILINPIIINDILFLVSKKNFLISLDLNKEEIIYSYDINKKISEFLKIKRKNADFKNIMMVDGKLLLFLQNSHTLVFDTRGTLEKVNKLPAKMATFPILIKNKILFLDKKNKLTIIN
tara:strand:- start:1616 stop:2941 length:1326 start_codon:yes stop_codon:yes gene_type:complete